MRTKITNYERPATTPKSAQINKSIQHTHTHTRNTPLTITGNASRAIAYYIGKCATLFFVWVFLITVDTRRCMRNDCITTNEPKARPSLCPYTRSRLLYIIKTTLASTFAPKTLETISQKTPEHTHTITTA